MGFEMKTQMEKVLDYAAKLGIKQCDVIGEKGNSFSLQAQGGKIDKTKISGNQVIGIRVIHEQKTGVSYSESLEDDSLMSMVKEALENSKWSTPDINDEIKIGPKLHQDIFSQATEGSGGEAREISLQEKVDLALRLESDVLNRDKRVVNVPYSGFTEGSSQKFYLNHLGHFCQHSFQSLSCYTSALAQENGQSSLFSHGTRSYTFEELNVKECIEESLKHSLQLLAAKPTSSGYYDIIFSIEALNELLGSFSSLFSAKSCMEEKNPWRNRLGEVVASTSLNLKDEPRLPGTFYHYYFDDEGICPQESTALIEGGVLKNFYHNTSTAKFFKTQSSGHASRSPKSALSVSGTHWKIEASGEGNGRTENDLRHGKFLEVVELQGLHSGTNPLSGHFSLAAKGYLADGTPVSGITISGNIFDLLKSIVGIGEKGKFDSQRSFYAPSIRFSNVSVAGQ